MIFQLYCNGEPVKDELFVDYKDGYNGYYHNPKYINNHPRVRQYKNKKYIRGSGKTGMTLQEYLKSNINPFNNLKYRFKKGYKRTSLKGKKRPDQSERNRDPEFIKKCLKGLIKKPNKPENVLIELFKKHNLPYKYIGDGEVIIGHWNPDFINCNGQKKIIEMYGDYWHNLNVNKNRDKLRLKTYSQYGFKTLIIWEHELKDIDKVLANVKKFESN